MGVTSNNLEAMLSGKETYDEVEAALNAMARQEQIDALGDE